MSWNGHLSEFYKVNSPTFVIKVNSFIFIYYVDLLIKNIYIYIFGRKEIGITLWQLQKGV